MPPRAAKSKAAAGGGGGGNVFAGLRIAVTNKCADRTQAEWKSIVEANGGKFAASVTKTTDFLIVPAGRSGDDKMAAAHRLGVPLVTPEWAEDSITSDSRKDPADYSPVEVVDLVDDDEEEEEEEEEEQKASDSGAGIFDGLSFVFSGKCLGYTRSQWQKMLEEEGGRLASSVSRTTDYLVCATALDTGKAAAAKQHKIVVVRPEFITDSIAAGKRADPKKYALDGGDGGEEDEEDEEEKKGGDDQAKANHQLFDGLTMVISGKLLNRTQAEWGRIISQAGGDVRGSVSSATDYLISVQGQTSAKVSAAHQLGVPVVRAEWIEDSLAAGALKPIADYLLPAPGAPAKSAVAAAAKSASGPAPSKKRKAAPADPDNDDQADPAELTKVVVKGRAPVDPRSGVADIAHVLQEPDGTVWDAMLNQTNIGNNNNKYYNLQLLKADANNNQYWVWFIWGRVGKVNGSQLEDHGNRLEDAKRSFRNKYTLKTKNSWENRANFVTYPGKYTLLERDYSVEDEDDLADDPDERKNAGEAGAEARSKLDPRVQDLVKLIFDVDTMKKQMVEIGYNANKLPLGKLSKQHIQNGYQVLKRIADALDGDGKHLVALSNEFYTLIPHDFGMKVPPVIRDKQMLKDKLEMIATLADIEVATKLLKKRNAPGDELHPVDAQYQRLGCGIQPIPKNGPEWKLITKMLKNTHADTHRYYELELQDAFSLDRDGENGRFGPWAKNENRMLLWHGSRISNYVGILSQGLRIAPPEAPVTGYMFGKGVYFADMISKSANYCRTSSTDSVGCLLLCEVALGEMHELYQADYYANNLPPGKLSTKGVGSTCPDPKGAVRDAGGCVAHTGVGVNQKLPKPSSLLYNEFIVYDVSQIRMRYMVQVKFKYN